MSGTTRLSPHATHIEPSSSFTTGAFSRSTSVCQPLHDTYGQGVGSGHAHETAASSDCTSTSSLACIHESSEHVSGTRSHEQFVTLKHAAHVLIYRMQTAAAMEHAWFQFASLDMPY